MRELCEELERLRFGRDCARSGIFRHWERRHDITGAINRGLIFWSSTAWKQKAMARQTQ